MKKNSISIPKNENGNLPMETSFDKENFHHFFRNIHKGGLKLRNIHAKTEQYSCQSRIRQYTLIFTFLLASYILKRLNFRFSYIC